MKMRQLAALLAVYVGLVLGYAPAWGLRNAAGERLLLLAWSGLISVVLAERFRGRWSALPLVAGAVIVTVTPRGYGREGLWIGLVLLGYTWFFVYHRLPAAVRATVERPWVLAALAGVGLALAGQLALPSARWSTAVCGGAIALLAVAGGRRVQRPWLLPLAGIALQTVWSARYFASHIRDSAIGNFAALNRPGLDVAPVLWWAALGLAATFLVDAFVTRVGRWAWLRGGLLVVLAMALKGMALMTWLLPTGDFDRLCNKACETLARGDNPYGHVWYLEGVSPPAHVHYVAGQEYAFVYPPGVIYGLLPFWHLGDFRYAYIACDVAVTVLWLLIDRSSAAWMLVAMYLYSPQSVYVLSAGWTDPLLLPLLSLAVLLWVRGRGTVTAAVLGLALATKHQALTMVLPAWRFCRERPARALWIGACALLPCLPFIVWNAGEFWRQMTITLAMPPRDDALTMATWLADCFPGLWVPGWMTLASWIMTVGLLAVQGRSRFSYTLGVTAVSFTLYFFGKWAFLNYYWFVACALLLTMMVCQAQEDRG
ncbi:MAG TPA: hypothetical protein VGO93_03055 [Candidatus Xenobia bacterium]